MVDNELPCSAEDGLGVGAAKEERTAGEQVQDEDCDLICGEEEERDLIGNQPVVIVADTGSGEWVPGGGAREGAETEAADAVGTAAGQEIGEFVSSWEEIFPTEEE